LVVELAEPDAVLGVGDVEVQDGPDEGEAAGLAGEAPACRSTTGLTDEWHPTQMLADFLTMHARCGRPYDEVAYAFVGDRRYNMGRSLLITGAIMGSNVRLVVPQAVRPPDDAAAGVEGADFVHTDDADGAPYPRDVLDAESGGQIGYVVELELDIALLALGSWTSRSLPTTSVSTRAPLQPEAGGGSRSRVCRTAGDLPSEQPEVHVRIDVHGALRASQCRALGQARRSVLLLGVWILDGRQDAVPGLRGHASRDSDRPV
jgi:hypothetical protein